MKYRYTGFGDRVFSEQDFISSGVNDQGDVVFVDSNEHIGTLSDDAARFLREVHHEPLDPIDDDGNVVDPPYEVEVHETAANAEAPETPEDAATTDQTVEASSPAGDTAAGAAKASKSKTR